MAKQFRPNQCPTCHWNRDNFACMNARCYNLPGEPYDPKGRSDWTCFKGRTDRKCGRYFEKQSDGQKETTSVKPNQTTESQP